MVTITDNAAKKIHHFSEDAPEGVGLRLRVTPGGCSGLSYSMGIELPPEEGDPLYHVFEENTVKVIIDKKSALYLAGAHIDYIDGLMASGFKIENPNARTTCGCGNSFA